MAAVSVSKVYKMFNFYDTEKQIARQQYNSCNLERKYHCNIFRLKAVHVMAPGLRSNFQYRSTSSRNTFYFSSNQAPLILVEERNIPWLYMQFQIYVSILIKLESCLSVCLSTFSKATKSPSVMKCQLQACFGPT